MTKGTTSLALVNYSLESDCKEGEEGERITRKAGGTVDEISNAAQKFECMSLHKREITKGDEDISCEKYGLWRQEQKNRAARLEKQLKAKWELEELIEEQLNRFHAHYNQALTPTRLKDMSQLLMPKWAPPHELAALSWLGDWRPSAILDLLYSLSRSSPSRSSSSLSESAGIELILSQLIHDIRIEEAIIDEEMAEIQATCILHLPFAPVNKQPAAAPLNCIQTEFKKVERVFAKAQQLRFQALELIVKKVLTQTDAAEFFVAFAGIQDAIHQFAAQQKLRKDLTTVPFKGLGSS
ncbi:uncharacterized protein LOC120007936 isoform X1 [Tripterygium wilfordii]|uniref:uncharacterized protein LOC120007936 isoform X1 n=1 Tax=Tripterygium wilfordii TaxID=458696 RepID=UPI0018F8127B|nr:uncharacterized protein LOC120007936 isoform X1 [Tripterygium wilfordii]